MYGTMKIKMYLQVTAARITHWSITVPYNTAIENCIILLQMKTNGFLGNMSKNCEEGLVMSHGITRLPTDELLWNFSLDFYWNL